MFRRVLLLGVALTFIGSLISLNFPDNNVQAAADCQLTISPSSATVNDQTDFTLTYTNNQSSAAQMITIATPLSDDVITSVSAPGWSGLTSSPDATLSAGTLNPGDSLSI